MRRNGNNILITLDEWIAAGLSYKTYENDRQRKYLQTANRACYGVGVEIIYNSIVKECRKQAIIDKFGDPVKKCHVYELERYIREDVEVKSFFTDYELNSGERLALKNHDKAVEYYNNAIVLMAAVDMLKQIKSKRRAIGCSTAKAWNVVASAVNEIRGKYPHTLPAHERRLRERYDLFTKHGLQSFVHKNYGNIHSRKVNEQLERLILSIYCMSNNPYGAWVHEYYMAFIAGLLDIVDLKTGVLFNREDFFDEKKGVYITISEATCRNYINNPKNRAIVESIRGTNHNYISNIRPHYHRHSPKWALSKISLDDRDLPRRMHDGNRVKAYYAYDVASGALIGAAYSVKKNTALFIDCLRDMFRFIDVRRYGMPQEVEVEHHIVGHFKDDLMKANVVFPIVRFCAPGNSQEKHAEQFNRQKKYGYEKRHQDGIGRFYARLEANRTGGERVYDETTDKYTIKEKTYSFEQLVADDRAAIENYNNGLHRDQKTYKGMTRIEVLHNRRNPELPAPNRVLLARYIGECATTSIQRNMYCRVQYQKYMLPTPEILARLAPNNYTVQAYYMPGDDIKNVYIYQNGEFIAECARIETFSTSQAETTDTDTSAMTEQAKYIAKFDKVIKEGKANLAKVRTINNLPQIATVEGEPWKTTDNEGEGNMVPVPVGDYSEEYWAERAMADF
ncbi:MAG: hypothetical protein LBH91_03155 [Prevotellaceae bacterium]|jgi:hypothetical protein|nr:hypothetical protein [Prevotellaceae bacterium]